MARAVFRNFVLGLGLVSAAFAVSVTAQTFSEGYEFLKAIKDRDGDAVTKFLNQPGSVIVNTRDLATKETALHIVTKRRDTLWIRFLTQKGANPNIRDKSGVTPLQIAASLGFLDGVEALIRAGAQVNAANSAGETPLIAAVHRRDTAMMRLLLAQGANPDRTDNSGRSARDYADLMTGNSQLLGEFDRADEAGESAGETKNYGPIL